MAENSLLLVCQQCGVKNFLDPYAFWDFAGKTRCAGCGEVYFVELRGGQLVRGPERSEGAPDQLPGYAETADYTPIVGPGKTRPAPQARADFVGKPRPITRSIRGKSVSGRPLTPEELVGSRPRFIVEGKEE